jgi:hypothetical protein
VTAIDGNVGRQLPTSTNKTGLQQREGKFSKEKNPCKSGVYPSGGTRTRTGDTMIFSHVLYHLSYPAV